MRDTACTGLAGVPSTYQVLLRRTRFRERAFPSLRWLQQAGGRLPEAAIREVRAAFPEVRLFVMYGQTEATARLSYLPPERLDEKIGSIGKGLASVRLEVLREDGLPVSPGSGEVGEIVASGESIADGYWDDPEETARVFRGGRLHTGDLARVDADGYLYLVDRVRDFVKVAGNRVSPRTVEEALAEHPAIVESSVVGAPDPVLGEALVAFVALVPGPGPGEAELQDHCRSRLPNHEVPSRFVFLDTLPKNESGKIQRRALRERAAAEVG
jgi:acyl-CoA synthetase (AMP-forming)/AMP-acid ligase II